MARKKKTAADEHLEGQKHFPGMEPPPPPDPLWKVVLTATAKRGEWGEPHDPELIEGRTSEDEDVDGGQMELFREELKRIVEVTISAPSRDDAVDAGSRQIHARVGELEDLFDDYGPDYIVSHKLDVKRT